jgi:hypothetical protein
VKSGKWLWSLSAEPKRQQSLEAASRRNIGRKEKVVEIKGSDAREQLH